MAYKNKQNPEGFQSQVDLFLDYFKKQRPEVREELANILPSYNKLLNMHARTFEELALLPLARENGLDCENPLFSFDVVKPPCPFCKEKHRIYKVKTNSYMCRNCGKKFAANYNSISSGTKYESTKWMQMLHCLLHAYTIKESCDYCGITPTTYYLIRNRLFYSMQLLLNDVKLYGNIFADITFTTVSYKGMQLDVPSYPEDSPFENDVFIPREPRYRGGQNTLKNRNANSNCIFCCIDEHGHVLARFIGIGKATMRAIKTKTDPSKFILDVPEQDPFILFKEHQEPANVMGAGGRSKLVSDKEKVIENYARELGLDYEGHVYRRNGKQLALGKDQMHIQRVNSLHSRLKKFLSYFNPSSKYLPGYLTLFEFIENTKASDQAIAALFEKLAMPHLGLESYDELYVVPNYLVEWLDDKNALKKIGYNRPLGFYLYDCFRAEQQCKKKTKKSLTLSEIEELTGYSPVTLRRNYKALSNAGYKEKIQKYFEKDKRAFKRSAAGQVEPVFLKIYDDWAENRKLVQGKRLSQAEFLSAINAKYNVSYTWCQLRYRFNMIQDQELRPPLPALAKKEKHDIPPAKKEKSLKIYNAYKKLEKPYKQRGEKIPTGVLYSVIAKEFGLSRDTIGNYIVIAKKIRKTKLLSEPKEQLNDVCK